MRDKQEAELEDRAEVALPPCACTWPPSTARSDAVSALFDVRDCPRTPTYWDRSTCRPASAARPRPDPGEPVIRMLVRVRKDEGLGLAASLRHAIAIASARHDHEAVRVQIDPVAHRVKPRRNSGSVN